MKNDTLPQMGIFFLLALMATTACSDATVFFDDTQGGIEFSGYHWYVKTGRKLGPGPNVFSSSTNCVQVLPDGSLRLASAWDGSDWLSAEVFLSNALGYGTYRFSLASPVDALDRQLVLGLFAWDDAPPEHHREIDIEFSRWGMASPGFNAQYVVQPFDTTGNMDRFLVGADGVSTHEFEWRAGQVVFRSHDAKGALVRSWTNSGPDVPTPGDERVHLNLWLYEGKNPAGDGSREVRIAQFCFTPLP